MLRPDKHNNVNNNLDLTCRWDYSIVESAPAFTVNFIGAVAPIKKNTEHTFICLSASSRVLSRAQNIPLESHLIFAFGYKFLVLMSRLKLKMGPRFANTWYESLPIFLFFENNLFINDLAVNEIANNSMKYQ